MNQPNGEAGGERVFQLLGGVMTFPVAGGDYDLADATFEPGFSPTPHVHHRHQELFCVLEGNIEFLCGDEVIQLGPGGVLNVPPGTVHDFYIPGPGPARVLAIVRPGGLHHYFHEVEQQILAGNLDESILSELRLKYDAENVPVVWRPEPSAATRG